MKVNHPIPMSIFARKAFLCFILFFMLVCLGGCGAGSSDESLSGDSGSPDDSDTQYHSMDSDESDDSDGSDGSDGSDDSDDSDDSDGSDDSDDSDGSDDSDDSDGSDGSDDSDDEYQLGSGFYLKGSNTEAGDLFGHSVAISGNTMVIGALAETSSATGVDGDQNDNNVKASGAAYVFRKDNNGLWKQEAYLKASNTGKDDWFGWSVAVHGDTIVVGTYREDSSATEINGDEYDDNETGYNGAAYVFVRDSDGAWYQEAYLKASNLEAFDEFGYGVSIWGDTIAVSARWEDGDGSSEDNNDKSHSGAAYVFTRENGAWSQEAYLKASNTDRNDSFGTSVALYEDTLVIGAIKEDSDGSGASNNDISNCGAAYVFTRENGIWSEDALLKASTPGYGDWFGFRVDISGDTIVVGADKECSNATGIDGNETNDSAIDSGAVYVFTKEEGNWHQEAYLKASDTASENYFGHSVAVLDDSIVVGAPGKASNTGRAYLFLRENGSWTQDSYFEAPDKDTEDYFGMSVAMTEDTIVVGAREEDSSATGTEGDGADNSAAESGAAYTF